MTSVTNRIKQIHQPRGGFLNLQDFDMYQYRDDINLNKENIHPITVGLAVDYLVRFRLGAPKEEAFRISLEGANIIGNKVKAQRLLNNINGLDTKSIVSSCKLVRYDVYRRTLTCNKPKNESPDELTVQNINTMVQRSCAFFAGQGEMILNGFCFEGGYTNIISSGDGDYLTKNSLIDIKVSIRKPTSKHTLQILIYYLMGIHSIHTEFIDIKRIGIFNPRLNIFYCLNIEDIDKCTLETVSRDIIGYNQIKHNENINYKYQKKPKYIIDMYGKKR